MSDTSLPETPELITPKVMEMQQLPIDGLQGHSALFEQISQTKNIQYVGVDLSEVPYLGHLVLRGNADDVTFSTAIKTVLGIPLPGALQSEKKDELSICWISPDEWLVMLPLNQAYEVEHNLRNVVDGHFAIVNVSGGQTVLRLSGPNALQVLHKSTPYDVHQRNFPVGKVVTTVFAKTQAVIRRTGPESWELVVRRSFADYIWRWLTDATKEYGEELVS